MKRSRVEDAVGLAEGLGGLAVAKARMLARVWRTAPRRGLRNGDARALPAPEILDVRLGLRPCSRSVMSVISTIGLPSAIHQGVGDDSTAPGRSRFP